MLASVLLTALHAPWRCAPPRANIPVDNIGGMDLQRQLGQLSFSEVTSFGRSPEDVLSGKAAQTTAGSEQVSVGLYYGELSSINVRGTRVLVKRYGSEDNRELGGRPLGEEASLEAQIATLQAALAGKGGQSVAEALAENEYAAHCRVQAKLGTDTERRGLLRMMGRQLPDSLADEAAILHAFPWKGEVTRMALPTSLPPTIASWAVARYRGDTPGSKFDDNVPRKCLKERGRYVRSALRGALSGLVELHAADMVHQSISPNAVLVSTTDDRVGDRASGMLAELGFCRDAPSLELVYRASPDGTSVLPAYEGTRDLLDSGLLDRAARKCRRPGDPENRAAFGKADDMREFALLVLGSVLLPNAQPGQPLDALKLRELCDGPFAASDDGMPTDGVDIDRLRSYLDAEDGLRIGGVGGVDVLDVGGAERSGWDLLALLLAPDWERRLSAEDALAHPWWSARMFF